ncbi:MAG TPA: amidohydrolase family protein, partial [Anaerovoracaceae bacterium]|nr:amidohydrolase family protein [Anaerovoracaceae bacterium]
MIQGGIAIRGNKIMAVGPNNIIDTLIGSGTNVYEFGDKLIMPGFIDAHFHLFMGAVINSSKITCTELIKSTSEEECVKIIKEFAEEHPGLDRIRGVGWFPANWKNKPLPTRKLL